MVCLIVHFVGDGGVEVGIGGLCGCGCGLRLGLWLLWLRLWWCWILRGSWRLCLLSGRGGYLLIGLIWCGLLCGLLLGLLLLLLLRLCGRRCAIGGRGSGHAGGISSQVTDGRVSRALPHGDRQ